MKKIHYHSDCSFFGGCENMLAVFFNSKVLKSNYHLSFSYRYSKAYESGLCQRVKELKNITRYPLSLICEYALMGLITQKTPKLIGFFLKILYVLIPIKYIIFLYNLIKMWRLFGKIKPDLVHINNGGYPAAMSASATVIAARLRGIKNIIYIINNVTKPYSKPMRWFDLPIDFFVKRSVSTFITGSEFAGAALKTVLGEKKVRWQKIYNGIKIREIKENPDQVVSRLHLSSERLRFGVIALFEERKGHIILIKAIEKLIEDKQTVPYILLEGHGVLKNSLQQYVKEKSLTEHIKFIGDEDLIFDFINSLDVLVLPSIKNEDFPNVILEAMALGKPAIGSEVAGIPEQISKGTGLVVPPRDIAALALAISTMVKSSEKRIQFGINAKKKFDQNFDQLISVRNYMQLYATLLEGI
jgi:L-malate glycosyltransferase